MRAIEILTPSEYEVAYWASHGLSNKQIAQKLYLSVRTVESHMEQAFKKLGIEKRISLVRFISSEDEPEMPISVKEQIKCLIQDGYNKPTDIASEIGCSLSYVYAYFRVMSLPVKNPYFERTIVESCQEKSQKELAIKNNCSVYTVSNILRKHKVETKQYVWFKGEYRRKIEIIREHKIHPMTVYYRQQKKGWSFEKAVCTPTKYQLRDRA